MDKIYKNIRWPNSLAACCLVLIVSLLLPYRVQASNPVDDPSGGVSGVVSDALACLTVGGSQPNTAAGVVNLNWQGQANEARLVLKISGSAAAHPIKVNGQPVAQTPIYAQGQGCGEGQYFELTIPAAAVVQGANRIEITNDAQPGDQWSAAYLRLYVLGQVTPPPPGQIEPATITAAASTLIITFTNSYGSPTSQQAMAQIPTTYTGSPTPLVIAVHGRSSSMQWGIDTYGGAADTKSWLLASPQLHGSWTGPTPPPPNPPGAYAYASLESQYDVAGTVKYMVDHYNVKPDQIYLVGESMGSQTGTVVAAKYPHLFAAIFDNMGPTDMTIWYAEQLSYYGNNYAEPVYRMRLECGGDSQDPSQNPFCYQRRSSINFAGNYIHIPISITHSISDTLVPVHHSRDLGNAINSYNPDRTASVYEDTAQAAACGSPYHCYQPDQASVLNFFEGFTLNNNPTHIRITTDESKSYYWLNIAQTGGDHWSQVEATYNPANKTVTATISDPNPSSIGFNLGSTPIAGIISQPGMGLPATTYLVKEANKTPALVNYSSSYLTSTLTSTGQFSLTISELKLQVSANPVSIPADGVSTSTLTVTATDQLGNAAPPGTVIQFSTTKGTLANGGVATISGSQGRATLVLTSDTSGGLAQVTAVVGMVSSSTAVNMVGQTSSISILVTPSQSTILAGQAVTYTYQVSNSGNTSLNSVTINDNNGTPANTGDDITVCNNLSLEVNEIKSCSRTVVLNQTATNTATVSGRDPLNNIVSASALTTVTVEGQIGTHSIIHLPIIIK